MTPVLEGSSLNQRTTREVLDAHLHGSQLGWTQGEKKSWVPESEGGQQEPRSLRAVKAPCTAGSGQGVVTENGKCKSISCCSEENEQHPRDCQEGWVFLELGEKELVVMVETKLERRGRGRLRQILVATLSKNEIFEGK